MPAQLSVSVAIATYQGERFLKQQLDSIARQTVLPLEVVITDDQSQDNTVQVAEDFARTAPFPVRVVRNEARLRYAENFLKAVSLCQGDLIAFCDQDDVWLEHKLSTCLRSFEDPEVQLVCHSAQTISSTGQLGYFFPHFRRTRVLRQGQCDPLQNVYGFSYVFRRTLLLPFPKDIRPKRLTGHDALTYFLAAVTGKVVHLKDVLAHYRQHENNVFGATQGSINRSLRLATEVPGYLNVACVETECSDYLSTSAQGLSGSLREQVLKWAKRLAFRSKLHTLRYRLYDKKFGILSRGSTYVQLWALGGYFPDRARTRLGAKAGLKDLLMGVTGLRRKQGA